MQSGLHIRGLRIRNHLRVPPRVLKEAVIRGIAFAARCSGAAALAYQSAIWVGLPHSLWAAMSAIIVSQERLADTRSSLTARIIGTLIGIGVAVGVNAAASRLDANLTVQIAAGVAICALVARRYPTVRVCMWTCPIVFLTAEPSVPTSMVALWRGSEVILGALIGAALHWFTEGVIKALAHGPAAVQS